MSESRGIRQAQIAWRPEIIALLKERASVNQIVESVGCSVPMVYKIAHEVGHQWKLPKPPKEPYSFDKEKYAREKVAEKLPSFEYVGGYTDCDGMALLRCKACGEVKEHSFVSIRKGRTVCKNCKRVETEARKAKKRYERIKASEAKRAEIEAKKQAEKIASATELRNAMSHPCAVCGKETVRPKYCSNACRNKSINKRKELKRYGVIKERMIDKDITVPSLIKRDGGVCYLCGKPCRMDDFIVKDGTIICGDWYPSIDHVVPLARGGLHAWENVRLAHRICNSMKSDNPPTAPKSQ